MKRGNRGHAALVWVHGGVHGNWDNRLWPFVKEAVDRGYVVICPDYRGSTDYGEAFHNEIDYGGYEIDDVLSAVDFLKALSHVDPDRLGIIGWSHGDSWNRVWTFFDWNLRPSEDRSRPPAAATR
jgi:dipeptidyl aminopeptidase/acylaminoacyl peptidase